jgi:hypothetical protein
MRSKFAKREIAALRVRSDGYNRLSVFSHVVAGGAEIGLSPLE